MQDSSDAHISAYKFSYISKNEFDSIFKHVKRERRKKHDEKVWEKYLAKKLEKRANSARNKAEEEENRPERVEENFELGQRRKCQKPVQPINSGPKEVGQCRGNHKTVERTENPQHDCQDCNCHNLGQVHEENAVDRGVPKAPVSDNKLYEITNFDEEFKRVEELRDKIIFTLQSIETALNHGHNKFLDEDEAMRSRLRSAEFAARFKRNYHYQITRQVNEIVKLNSNESWKKTNFPVAVKKFKSSHQVAVQGLQAVEKHLRTTSDSSPQLWLQDFLSSICEMENLFSSVFDSTTDQDRMAFSNACSSVTQQLDSPNKRKKEPEIKKKKKKHAVKRNEVKDNLWMYRTHKDWKTKASELARVKLAKINRRKVEPNDQTDKLDTKPIANTSPPDNLQDLKMEVKQREGASHRKQVRSMKEDQVRTMMEIVPDATDSDHDDDKQYEEVKEAASVQDVESVNSDETKRRLEALSTSNKPSTVRNVSLICVTSEEENPPPTADSVSLTETLQTVNVQKLNGNAAVRYRTALQAYQRKQKWYDPNFLSSVDRITECIYNDLMRSIASEINVDHIISNLIHLEMRT